MSIKEGDKKKQKSKPQQKKSAKRTDSNHAGKWIWAALAIVLVTTFIIYLRATSFDLLLFWDDNSYITNNDHIKALHWENIRLIFTNFYTSNYQPITMLFYAIEYKIGHGQAFIFHFINILFHLLNTYLVYVFIRKISPKNAMVALITAAFFAVHPMHVESVAWVAERKDVMYSFFFLLSLIIYLKYLESKELKHLAATLILFVLSCLSKSAAVIFPLVLLLIDYYSARRLNWKMAIEKIPFFIISLVFGIVAIYSQKSSGVLQDWAPNMSFIEHLAIVSFSFVSYFFKAFIPVNLSAIYPYPIEIGKTLSAIYFLSILFVGIALFFVWYSRRWGKDILFGFLFFVITIILVLQFIPVGSAIMADRYTYIPYIGIFFIVGKIYERLSTKLSAKNSFQKISLSVLFIFFIGFSIISFGRVKVWENDDTLFSDVIKKYPNCSNAYVNRGNFYNAYYAKKVYVNDKIKSEAYIKKAINDFDNAIKFELIPKNNWRAYFNLGLAKGDLGDIVGAAEDFGNSIELHPDNRYSYLYRGVYFLNYFANNMYVNDKIKREMYIRRSIEDFENSLKLTLNQPEKIQLYKNIGTAKAQLGDYAGAISSYDEIVKIDPNNAEAYVKRSDVRYQIKDYEGALEDCNKAIELNPQDVNSIKNRDIVKAVLENSKK
jgi:protein O-mannosyl-transferase